MKIIEVYRHTKPTFGNIGRLISVHCVIDNKKRIVSAEDWKNLVSHPGVEISLSEKEGAWPNV